MSCPDNYDQLRTHERKQEQWLDELPHCDRCDNAIQDDCYYEINEIVICEECLETHYRKFV